MSHSLLTLFAPPEGHVGDFGMLCGFTASRDVLDRIARNFSGDGSRPHLAAFVHPTAGAVTDVPGVAWMHFRQQPFRLLHAKVALLGFRSRDAYRLRLAVSTGNWTAEPLTTSIDMFWCGELAVDARDPQLVSDIRAADGLFHWLRGLCDESLLRQTFDGALADEAFRQALHALPESRRKPRFVDTRTATMRRQVIERLTGSEKAHLVIGSGYYEAGGEEEEKTLLQSLCRELVRRKRLADDAQLDLVINPDSCQGLHMQAADLVGNGWTLRKPASCHAEHNQARLHAKYLLVAENAGPGTIGDARIYVGSANFSRMGFESTARGGNLEAGIVIAPDPDLSWRRNAANPIRKHLPGDFDTEVDTAALAAGAAFVSPPAPPPPPPVTFLDWAEGRLQAPEYCEEAIEVIGRDDARVGLPCDWPAPPPAFVTLHPDGWRVPVRADGALVVPKRGLPSLEDILAGLGRFPASGISTVDEEEEEEDETFGGGEGPGPGADPMRSYPVRQMMRLVVRLAEMQKDLDSRDWQRWCRELRQDLPGLAETEKEMIAPFVAAGVNPLTAIVDPEFLPDGVDAGLIEAALRKIGDSWGLSGAEDLWKRTT